MKVAIGNDHAGYTAKIRLLKYLVGEGIEVEDMGSFNDEPVDYPDYGHKIANAVSKKAVEFGVTICGSGNGINMTVNKHQNIRAALCWNEEIARLARLHNDANICSLPGRFISEEEAIVIVRKFIATGFEGGRHERRIKKIPLKNTL